MPLETQDAENTAAGYRNLVDQSRELTNEIQVRRLLLIQVPLTNWNAMPKLNGPIYQFPK